MAAGDSVNDDGHDHHAHDCVHDEGRDHAHDAHEDHGHAHRHGHHHAPADYGSRFIIGIALNVGFVAVEATFGILSDSMALLADAGHNMSDVLGLVAGWAAVMLARRKPSARFTYGMRRASVVAALFNSVLLMVAVGAIALEAVHRLMAPEPVAVGTVIVVALIGIVVNGATAWLFAGGHDDLNVRGAFLHMVADAAVSAGVVVAALVIGATGLTWIDPVVSLIIGGIIVAGTWGLLRDSVALSLDAVPRGLSVALIDEALRRIPHVTNVHHIHIWPLSTTDTALTCHLSIVEGQSSDQILGEATALLHTAFRITHTTIQIETVGCAD